MICCKKIGFFLAFFFVIFSLSAQDNTPEQRTPRGVSEAEQKENADAFAGAYKFLLLENFESAEKAFRDLVARYKWDAASRYELARLLVGTGSVQEALQMAEEAYDLDQSNKWYGELLGSLYEQTGQNAKLISLIEKMLKENPNNTAALEKIAQAWLLNNKPAKALVYLNKIEKIEGVSEALSLQKHRIYADGLKKNKEAARELVLLSEAFPDESRYKIMLAEFYGKTGETAQAVKIYEQMLKQDPNDVYTAISMADLYQKLGDRGNVFNTLKRAFESPALGAEPKLQVFLTLYTPEQIYDSEKVAALELITILNTAHPREPKLLAIKGDLLYKAKREQEARADLVQSIALDSSRYFVWEQVLFVMSSLNDTLGLASYSNRCRQLFPFQPIPFFFEGMMQARNGNHAEAARLFMEGKSLVSGNPALAEQFAMFLGDTYHALDEPVKSDSAYEEALRLNADNVYVLNNYAYYLSVRKTALEKAEKMSAKAIAMEPNNATYLDTYAWVLYQQGRYEEAHYWIEKTLNADPSPSATLYDHAGDILFKLNRVEEAVGMWQKALQTSPGDKTIERKTLNRRLDE